MIQWNEEAGKPAGIQSRRQPEISDAPVIVNSETFQEMLSLSSGKYVICEMLIGVDNLVLREGILTEVGPSYFVLYDEERKAYTSCDLYSVKFVTHFASGKRPNTEEYYEWLRALRSGNHYASVGGAQGASACQCTANAQNSGKTCLSLPMLPLAFVCEQNT